MGKLGVCHYCGETGPMTRDHLIPVSLRREWIRYGTVSPEADRYFKGLPYEATPNVMIHFGTVPACPSCNNKRGTRPYAEFQFWLNSDDGHRWKRERAEEREANARWDGQTAAFNGK